jgi:hypothetical protein
MVSNGRGKNDHDLDDENRFVFHSQPYKVVELTKKHQHGDILISARVTVHMKHHKKSHKIG